MTVVRGLSSRFCRVRCAFLPSQSRWYLYGRCIAKSRNAVYICIHKRARDKCRFNILCLTTDRVPSCEAPVSHTVLGDLSSLFLLLPASPRFYRPWLFHVKVIVDTSDDRFCSDAVVNRRSQLFMKYGETESLAEALLDSLSHAKSLEESRFYTF